MLPSEPPEPVSSPDFSDILGKPPKEPDVTGFAPPYPDLSELLPPSKVAAQAIVGEVVDEPFDEDDEFAKRWVVCQIGRSYARLVADTSFPITAGPFSLREADQFIEDMRLVQDVMDR